MTLQPGQRIAAPFLAAPAEVKTFVARILDAEDFFLNIEAHRLRLAHQFDPQLAVSVSQVDPLPHQIEAVYHYALRSLDVLIQESNQKILDYQLRRQLGGEMDLALHRTQKPAPQLRMEEDIQATGYIVHEETWRDRAEGLTD